MMKRSFIVVAALLLLVGGFSAAEESVLIDFNLLSADIIEETDNPLRAYPPFHPAVKSMSTPE